MVITDEVHNRMRIIMPVVRADALETDDLRVMLEANFDRALDARYAIGQDVIWAAFIHPLAELTRREFQSALRQVQTLRDNYGTSYSSGELIFAPQEQQVPDEESGKLSGTGGRTQSDQVF